MKVKTVMYFNSSKEDSVYNFKELCEENDFNPSEDAVNNSCYAGYEVGINVEWDLETGNCEFIKLSE